MIAVSYAGLMLLSGYGYRTGRHLTVNAVYNNHFGDVSIYRKGGLVNGLSDPASFNMEPEEQQALQATLQQLPTVDFVGRYLVGTGMLSNGCDAIPFVAAGLDMAVEDRIRRHPALHRWLSAGSDAPPTLALADFVGSASGAITVTSTMAVQLRKPQVASEFAGKPVRPYEPVADCQSAAAASAIGSDADVQLLARDPNGDVLVRDGTIVQRFNSGRPFSDDVQVNTSLAFLQSLFQTQAVSYLAVFLKPGASPTQFVEDFAGAAYPDRASKYDVYTATDERLNPIDASVIAWHESVEIFMSILIGLIVMVIVVNFLSLSIIERRTEIGTMLALGFDSKSVMGVIRCEFLLIIVGGLAAGVTVAWLARAAINQAGIIYHPPVTSGSTVFLIDFYLPRVLAQAGILIAAALASIQLTLRRAASQTVIVDLFRNIHT